MTRTFGDHDVALVDEQRAAGERVGWELVAVRETPRGALDVGIGASDFPEFRDLEDRGFGTDLKTPAFDEIREHVDELDVEIGPGDTVAVIYYDLENWSSDVEFVGRFRRSLLQQRLDALQSVSLFDRLRALLG